VFDKLGPANYDIIDDFSVPDDAFRLDSSVFVGLFPGPANVGDFVVGKHAIDPYDLIVYDKATGDLMFDVDGAGGAAAVKFAAVDPGTPLTAADFYVF
jgi:Ca2+-binding RTX toxin-like protein